MVVGGENAKTFRLHSELLAHESDRLAKDVKGGFGEQSSKSILLDEEDPDLFGYFVEYMYRGTWLEEQETLRESDYIILARLYALAERLQASKLQYAALRKFASSLTYKTSFSDQCICELLDIACAELPERVDEDPLRKQIFWYAASRLTQLQDYDYFLRLLESHKDLGKNMCIRASDGSDRQPQKPAAPLPRRFKPESIY